MDSTMTLYLVEVASSEEMDDKFCEAVVAASSQKRAIAAVLDMGKNFDLTFPHKQFQVTELGPLKTKLAASRIRWPYKGSAVLAVTVQHAADLT